jgi:hypothetical protein
MIGKEMSAISVKLLGEDRVRYFFGYTLAPPPFLANAEAAVK